MGVVDAEEVLHHWPGIPAASSVSVTVDGGGCLDLRCQVVPSEVDDGEVEENEAGSAVAASA